MHQYNYVRDPGEIYRQSFSTVKSEAELEQLPQDMRQLAIRLIHSCGMVDVVDDLAFSKDAAESGLNALNRGHPIYCDVEMVRAGIIERLLPSKNDVICTLNLEEVPGHATQIENTRSAAAVDFWDRLAGSVVVIGNAPTALFRVLEVCASQKIQPALIIGIPVGFVGAVESKQALASNSLNIPFITVHGRRGGSAMASAALNALAGGLN